MYRFLLFLFLVLFLAIPSCDTLEEAQGASYVHLPSGGRIVTTLPDPDTYPTGGFYITFEDEPGCTIPSYFDAIFTGVSGRIDIGMCATDTVASDTTVHCTSITDVQPLASVSIALPPGVCVYGGSRASVWESSEISWCPPGSSCLPWGVPDPLAGTRKCYDHGRPWDCADWAPLIGPIRAR